MQIGIATSTDPKNIAIFAGSLRNRAKANCTVILFINSPVDHITRILSLKYRLVLIEFTLTDLQPSFLRNYHPSSIRWILMHQLFSTNTEFFEKYYDKMVTLDVRDSMFQTTPFRLFKNKERKFFVFGEGGYVRILECGWNSGWIKDCFGDKGLTAVGDQPIICSGVSMGTRTHMMQYVHVMNNVLLGYFTNVNHTIPDPTSLFPRCERNGVDQGVHNYLVHSRAFPFQVDVKYPEFFPVINMQSSQEYEPLPSDKTTILMGNNKEFSIVHQYDRNIEMQLALGRRYVDWVDWNNPEKEWKEMSSCNHHFDLPLNHADLFRGVCDSGSARAMTPATCCDLCRNRGKNFDSETGNQNKKDCTGFTFVNGVCYFKDCPKNLLTLQLNEYKKQRQKRDFEMSSTFAEKSAVSAYVKF